MVVMFRARLAALLVALLALAPVVAHAHARYFCRMMERVVDDCCCAVEPTFAASDSEPEARSPDCCVRLTQGSLPSADTTRNSVAPMAALPAAAAPEAHVFIPTPGVVLGAVAEDDVAPAHGPPLFLEHCAFLI
jgi:hypothetical protein